MKARNVLFAALLGEASLARNSALLSSHTVELGAYQSAYEKAKTLVDSLNNTEKITIITGGSIDGVWTALESNDGVSGVGSNYYVSGFVGANALAMTWDRDLTYNQFHAAGEEFYGMGYNLVYGPMCGPLGRTPWGGRQPEAFSADPYLAGMLMEEAVSGQNAAGVIATGRHFILNEQETNRSDMTGVSTAHSANADDKTMHELYLWPFANAVKSGMGAVMCGMNKVNGSFSCENEAALSGLLKAELGFPGLVVPDVQSQKTSFGSANAGLDYGSSSLWAEETMLAGLRNGSLTQARLDDMAIRNVIGYFHVGLDEGKQSPVADYTEHRNVRGNHSAMIRQIGSESLVLLKNNNDGGRGLPLNKPDTLAVFGAHARAPIAGPNHAFSILGAEADTYNGHLATPSGSGSSSFAYVVDPYMALMTRQMQDGGMMWWMLNDTYSSGGSSSNTAGVTIPGAGTSLAPSYTNYAQNAAACLVFLNAYSGEGADRGELSNKDQDAMVNSVAGECSNTIVVVSTVGPRLVEDWIEHENVTAVLYGGLLGQESGNSIVDVLFGDVNPSGKLTHTIARNANDYPVSICHTANCNFTEGVYIDYRWFDAKNTTPRYEFGYGLSYTTFTIGSMSATVTNSSALNSRYPTGNMGLGGPVDLWNEVIQVTTSVNNTGSITGAEVVQLYITFPTEAAQPSRVLRGFEKVKVQAGASEKVTLSLRRRDLSYWDTAAQKWAVASGRYVFAVGSSSRDIQGTAVLDI
ncbi:glycoside hydrolase superfamily [Aspergillus unguis]